VTVEQIIAARFPAIHARNLFEPPIAVLSLSGANWSTGT